MRSRRQKHGKQTKLTKKWKIRISVLAAFTLIQWGGMYGLDHYLQPTVPTVATPVQAASTDDTPVVTTVEVPADAVRSLLSTDQQHAAYTTADQHLVLADKAGTTFDQQMNGDVVYMQWLGNSNTLLYFVQGSYLDAWLLPLNSDQPVLIHEWFGKDRQVQNTYFSSYMEYLYVELENQSQNVTEVYKYDAIGGISQLPLENVQINSIDYDDKDDIMRLTDAQGGVWKYEKDRLYRPDGSEVYQSVIVNHPPPSGTATLTPTTPTMPNGTDKTDPGKGEPGKTDPTTPPGTGCAGSGTGTNGTGSSTGSTTGTVTSGTGTSANGTGAGTKGSGATTPCSGNTTPGSGGTTPPGAPGTTGGTGTVTGGGTGGTTGGNTGGSTGGTKGNTNPPTDPKTGGGGSNNPPPSNGGGGTGGNGGTGTGGGGTGGGH